MRFESRMQLALDAALGAARRAKGRTRTGGAELRPGSHVVYTTEARRDANGREYLYAGPIHRSFWRTIEWRLLRPIVKDLPRPLADIGCGDGEFGKMLFQTVDLGVDGEAETIGHCDPKIYMKTALVDLRKEMPGGAGAFGAIFSNSTLEHIEGVDAVLKNLATATRPGGRFVATVPSSGLVRAFTNGFGREYCDELNGILGHHNLWTADEWTRKLKAAGFAEVTTRGYMTDDAACWFASLHLPPWPQIARRAKNWVWTSQMPRFMDLVEASLGERAEGKTACLLLEGKR